MGAEGKRVLVVGGGITGISTAMEAAAAGREVILVEKRPYLGGRVVQMHRCFPELCPPACGIEISLKRMRAHDSRITVLTLCEVKSIEGTPGAFTVTVERKPRFVNSNCAACGACVAACPVERSDDVNFGLKKTKAIDLEERPAGG